LANVVLKRRCKLLSFFTIIFAFYLYDVLNYIETGALTATDLYKYSMLDAVPPIHAVSSHVATDKGPP